MNIFSLPPDWSGGITVKYRHNTIIHTAQNKKEQRTSLREYPIRDITFTAFDDSFAVVKQLNILKETIKSEVAVPIYSEPILLDNTGDLAGVTTLLCKDISDYFNVNTFGGAVIIVDKLGNISPEYSAITSVAGNTVVIDAITGHFTGQYTICFPAIVGYLPDFPELTHVTDGIGEFEVTFSERRTLPLPISVVEWQDSGVPVEYQDGIVGQEYQNI